MNNLLSSGSLVEFSEYLGCTERDLSRLIVLKSRADYQRLLNWGNSRSLDDMPQVGLI